MIIQHPDGSYEHCPLPPLLMLWLRGLLRGGQAFVALARQRVAMRGGPWRSAGTAHCQPCDGGAGA